MKITRKTRDKLAKAPLPKTVWNKFAQFCDKYNFKKTSYYAPIAAGYNINGYDMPIVDRMCQQYGPTHAKNGRQGIFNPIYTIDVMQHIYSFEAQLCIHILNGQRQTKWQRKEKRDIVSCSKPSAKMWKNNQQKKKPPVGKVCADLYKSM